MRSTSWPHKQLLWSRSEGHSSGGRYRRKLYSTSRAGLPFLLVQQSIRSLRLLYLSSCRLCTESKSIFLLLYYYFLSIKICTRGIIAPVSAGLFNHKLFKIILYSFSSIEFFFLPRSCRNFGKIKNRRKVW